MNPKKIVVIGGGVGGLATALRLAHAGHSVTVLEQNARIGGKLNVWEPDVPGVGRFRFDTGPHVLTMPWAFEELFADIGERMADFLTLQRIDPLCRYHFPDAPYFDASANLATARGDVATRFPGDEDGFAALLRYARRVNDVTVAPFLRQNFNDAIRGIPTPAQWRQLADFLSLTPWRTLHDHVSRYVKHPQLRQIFDLYALYNGSSPYCASAIYAIIAHVQWADGTYYLRGGLRTLADALETLARRKNVRFRTQTAVAEILFEPGQKSRAVGVLTAHGETIAADAVVCNSDPLTTYAHLVSEEYRPKPFQKGKLETLDPSTSAFLLLLGVRGEYGHLAHYNSFLPADPDAEYRAIFDKHVPADDPLLGVTCQSVTEPGCAPPGYSNLFVMASPPALGKSFAWMPEAVAAYRDRIVHLLETRCGMADLSHRIVCEQVWTPETFAARYGAWRGSLYGLSSNSVQNGFLRPPNRATHARGLYFVGGGTHPGGGLPLVTLGAKIVADAVCADFEAKN